MARKWYRSLLLPDPEGKHILVGGAYPGEVFQFDYDRPGFHEDALVDNGVIEVMTSEPTKEDLAAVARRHGVAGGESMKKEDLMALLDEYWEG